jgi:hypothetical protein
MRSAGTELQNIIKLYVPALEIATPKPAFEAKPEKIRF